MFKSNLIKFISLFFIVIGAQILLAMIEEQIDMRSSQSYYASDSVKSSWSGNQTLLASVLVVPFERAEKTRVFDKELKRYVEKIKWVYEETFILPKKININARLKHQVLSKGIYKIPVYTSKIALSGNFKLDKLKALTKDKNIRLAKSVYLSTGITDSKGFAGNPSISLNQQPIKALPGSKLSFYLQGFHAELPIKQLEDFSFGVEMQFKGMGAISFIATAVENRVKVESDWPHPSFYGAFLPTEREISNTGYQASWLTGIFATNIEETMNQCFKTECEELYGSSFGVDHIQPVDIYLKSLRTIKYGLLVVIITFTIFVLYEVLNKAVRIHPVSYSLTGMALAIFFLLLIALSEHLGFLLSYWISALACSSLISYYVSHLSHSKWHGGGMFVILNGFYLVLFFIIRSEDHALLSGSILLFALLAVVMVVTRRINWYNPTAG